MKYEIEEATIDDLDIIVDLKFKMFEDANLLDLLKENCKEQIKETYTDLYNSNLAKHYIISNKNEIIAMAGAFIKNDIPYCFYKNDKYGFIGDMYTKINYRRLGFAQELLSKSIEWLKNQCIKEIQLLASEQGRKLYINNNFKQKEELLILKI